MPLLQECASEYELNKYLQLAANGAPGARSSVLDVPKFTYALSEDSTLRESLTTHVELAIARFDVEGAFIVLTNGNAPRFFAGTRSAQSESIPSDEDGNQGVAWLGTTDTDQSIWNWLFRQTIAVDTSTRQTTFVIERLRNNERTVDLSSALNTPHLSFYAGAPIVSKHGQNIGAVFVVDNSKRSGLSMRESEFLTTTARKCMHLLELTRQKDFHNRWSRINDQLDHFVKSRAILAQELEEPPSLKKQKSDPRTKGEIEQVDSDVVEEPLMAQHDPTIKGDESKRLVQATIDRDKRIALEDNEKNPRAQTGQADQDDGQSGGRGETTYRKVFRRAAECLRKAFGTDGVLFTDGLVGFHGGVQPIAETEQELEREMIQRPWRKPAHTGTTHKNAIPYENDSSRSSSRGSNIDDDSRTASRRFTSADYQRGVYVERPAEIVGICTLDEGKFKTATVSPSTKGLTGVDEGFLQRLMDRHPDGAVWYFHETVDKTFLVRDCRLVDQDLHEETTRLKAAFQNLRQLVFQPLTHPTSLKRLAGCFLWTDKTLPVFTDTVDLNSLKGFLHVVESEIARFDASAAVKQQEAFVSSVSHELRTPLHGILGAVQLLEDTGLDPVQKALAGTITSCGSTLHETLTSVLSYAKINQFERRQHKFRQRRPPDSVWALPGKQGASSGPDRDFEGLYICTNVAMLCEEIVGVLEAGQSFGKSTAAGKLIVVLNVRYDDNWCFWTEPGALRRIAANLIGNALKYTSEGSVTVTLTSSKVITDPTIISNDRTSGRMLRLTIKDTGKGMGKDFVDNHLFVPFTQEDSSSSQGVGLGMSIVKSLTSLLSGEINVRSEVGKGTEIRVSMPMQLCEMTGDEDNQKPAVRFAQDIEYIRRQQLSVVIYGFPDFVYESLESYLREWFHCTILENRDDAEPDIVLVDEGNEHVQDDVKRTAQQYGRRGVLLSIVLSSPRLAQHMHEIKGYQKWERIPRPLGPGNMAKALYACMSKQNELREGRNGGTSDPSSEERGTGAETEERSPKDGKGSSGAAHQRSKATEPESPAPEENAPTATTTSSTTTQEQRRPPAPARSVSTTSLSGSSGRDSSGLRVLLVDDNALNLRLLGAFLKRNGYQDIQQAENGAIAVDTFKSHTFDIVFMDMSMPVMNGFDATRMIREIENEQSPPDASNTTAAAFIVALTGLASSRDEEAAFDAGCDMFITKPVQFGNLSKLLKQCKDGTLKKGRHSRETSEG